jgi:solute carrier family 9 (sodium/hydrogen exchanger), member 8
MHPIPFRMQVVMWFAGLRGAIAFALSLNVPTEHKTSIVTCTMVIVIFTTLVLGGFTEPLLSRMGLKRDGEYELVVVDGSTNTGPDRPGSENTSDASRDQGSTSPLSSSGYSSPQSRPSTASKAHAPNGAVRRMWHDFDKKFMKPVFGGDPRSADNRQALEASSEITMDDNSYGDSLDHYEKELSRELAEMERDMQS